METARRRSAPRGTRPRSLVDSLALTAPAATEAIVLRLLDHGDKHRIVTLFTQAHGRLAALARGARSATSRFGGHLDLFHRGEALLKLRSGLAELASFHVHDPHASVRDDVVKFAIASFVVDLVMATTSEGDASAPQFEVLASILSELAASPEGRRLDLVLAVQLRWFGTMGVLPDLDEASLARAGLPILDDQPLAIARALAAGVPIPDLDADRFHAVGALTRAVRLRVAARPLESLRFLHQELED